MPGHLDILVGSYYAQSKAAAEMHALIWFGITLSAEHGNNKLTNTAPEQKKINSYTKMITVIYYHKKTFILNNTTMHCLNRQIGPYYSCKQSFLS